MLLQYLHLVNTGSGNILLPDSTKPLPEMMLTLIIKYILKIYFNQILFEILKNFIQKCF